MGAVLVALTGILLGSLVNVYTCYEEKYQPIIHWYLGFFYKRIRYIIIDILLAVVLFVIYKNFGLSIDFIKFAVMGVILAAAGIKDLQNKIIPNKLVLTGIISGLILSISYLRLEAIFDSLLGFAIAGGLLGILYFISRGGVGVGDVKLFACAGLFLGFNYIGAALILSTVASGITGIILLIARIKDRKGTIPFAPFIFVGSVLAIIAV